MNLFFVGVIVGIPIGAIALILGMRIYVFLDGPIRQAQAKAQPPYRLDVHYPLPLDDDIENAIEQAVGCKAGSSGGGFGKRDMQFYFTMASDRSWAAGRIGGLGLGNVSVVRREELDP